jgi:hypothetical protein
MIDDSENLGRRGYDVSATFTTDGYVIICTGDRKGFDHSIIQALPPFLSLERMSTNRTRNQPTNWGFFVGLQLAGT